MVFLWILKHFVFSLLDVMRITIENFVVLYGVAMDIINFIIYYWGNIWYLTGFITLYDLYFAVWWLFDYLNDFLTIWNWLFDYLDDYFEIWIDFLKWLSELMRFIMIFIVIWCLELIIDVWLLDIYYCTL